MTNKIKYSLVAAILATSLNANEDFASAIVYSATKSEQSIQDVTSDVKVITGAELEERHVISVIDALRLSGISLTQSGGLGQSSSFFMNGLSAEHTLVMIDGIRYNDPTVTNGYALLDQIMVANIDRIEIVNGAQSGIWGADAAAGIINIITKKSSQELEAITNIEYGSFDTRKYGLSLSQTLDKISYYVGYNKIISDGFSAMSPQGIDPENYEDDGYTNETYNLKFDYKITDVDTIKFNTTRIKSYGDYDDQYGSSPIQNDTSTHETKNNFTDITYNHIDSFQTTNLYARRANFDRRVGSGIYKGHMKEFGFNSHIPYLTNNFIQFGIDKKQQVMESSYSALEGEYTSKGIFVTNNNTFDNLIITESLRHDEYDKFDGKTTGKLGLKYKITNDFDVSVNYGVAYKAPSLYNLYAGYSGNINLIPETIDTQDITIEFKDIKVTLFNTKIEDEILYSNSTWQYEQSDGISKYKGFKVDYQKLLTENILFNFNYMKQSAKDKDGNDLQRRVKDTSKISLDYYGIENLHIGTDIQYFGERYDELAKTTQTGKYTVMNMASNYEINQDSSVYFKIDNVTDRLYQEVNGYATAGRTFSIGLNKKF